MKGKFEPKIVAFLCNWCSYAGADSAGGQRRNVPQQVKTIRVMCSGRIDPQFVIEAFQKGADGVMILGCHIGDCHYKEGNLMMLRRMKLMGTMLDQLGIERERFRVDWVSASEGEKFAAVTHEMVETVRALGPIEALAEVA